MFVGIVIFTGSSNKHFQFWGMIRLYGNISLLLSKKRALYFFSVNLNWLPEIIDLNNKWD